MKAAYKEITKLIPFDIDNQTLTAYSTYQKVIPLGRDDWDVAFVTLWNKNQTQVDSKYKRLSGFLVLTANENDGYSQVSFPHTDLVYPYPATIYYYITNHRYRGFTYANDTILSLGVFDIYGRAVRVNKGVIDGSDLKIDFFNTYPSTHFMRVQGVVKLTKTVLL